MAVISDATAAWSATVTLAANEFWQVRAGPVFIATGATSVPSSLDDGLLLSDGDILALGSGEVVRYRSARPDGSAALIRRTKV
jgi:hypothetical protein